MAYTQIFTTCQTTQLFTYLLKETIQRNYEIVDISGDLKVIKLEFEYNDKTVLTPA